VRSHRKTRERRGRDLFRFLFLTASKPLGGDPTIAPNAPDDSEMSRRHSLTLASPPPSPTLPLLSLSFFASRHASNPPVTRFRPISPTTDLDSPISGRAERAALLVRSSQRLGQNHHCSRIPRANNLRDRNGNVRRRLREWLARAAVV